MIKILLLSRYCRIGASSRLRSLQYLPYLKKNGYHIDVHPFYSESYLTNLYQRGRRKWSQMLVSHLKRVIVAAKIGNYDLIWIEKEVFPWLPAFAEKLLQHLRIPYVVDFDDAIFHKYDLHRYLIVRQLLGNKIDSVMKGASLVIAGNSYLATRAMKNAGAKNVLLLPTVIDLNRYKVRSRKKASPFTIGWIGSPTTADYLCHILPVLSELQSKYSMRVVVVGAGKKQLQNVPFKFLPWSERSEVGVIQTFDVGIMPLPDTPWSKGKCGYKLIQYMACGVPVVASNIGANSEIVCHGKHGFLTHKKNDWYQAILTLYLSNDLRQSMSLNCRDRVEERFNLDITAPVLEKHLRQVGSYQT